MPPFEKTCAEVGIEKMERSPAYVNGGVQAAPLFAPWHSDVVVVDRAQRLPAAVNTTRHASLQRSLAFTLVWVKIGA